jgi:hypothetical protein
MAYGVTLTSLLLMVGIAIAVASASVNMAEVVTLRCHLVQGSGRGFFKQG